MFSTDRKASILPSQGRRNSIVSSDPPHPIGVQSEQSILAYYYDDIGPESMYASLEVSSEINAHFKFEDVNIEPVVTRHLSIIQPTHIQSSLDFQQFKDENVCKNDNQLE